ncbi:hypothetical protein [Helicobacter bizzozeronii]|uniref:Uncharacterized protein n=1 Tax=Helicobacter bizzozeronii (strain CIII-1) TaxID=1002804 RepID=F8KPM8_HELBC|nr:hypothetical protein [Helicobacter bizzozeronii]CCB80756.1 hypothetical protein HBZC1_17700 [Helicobacter bizzozeronii CIII-1]
MGLNEIARHDLQGILGESFRAYDRARPCLSSYDPYLLGEDRFVSYKLCLITPLKDNYDLETGGALVYDKKTWRIVHIERARAILRLFLQEYREGTC